MGLPISAISPRRRRLGFAIAALASAAAVALPAQAVAAPAGGTAKSGGTASFSRALGKGNVAKASKRKRHSRDHRAAKQAPKPQAGKPQATKPQTGGAGSAPNAPAASAPANSKPSRSTSKPPATIPPPATTTPPPATIPPSSGTTTPPSTTPPPSTSPSSELLFNGSRIRDFALLQAAPNAITEVADPLGGGETVLKLSVNETDVAPITPTSNPRAQALSPDVIKPGQEIWLSTKFLIPADFPSSVPGWMSLIEIYGAPFGGPSPWGVGISGTDLSWERNSNYGWDQPWKMPLPRGQWTTILLHERFASDGFVEMWVNGAPVTFFASSSSSYNPSRRAATQHLEMKTVDSSNGAGANAAKIMQYRKSGMFQSASVYFGALKVGTTRTAVGA